MTEAALEMITCFMTIISSVMTEQHREGGFISKTENQLRDYVLFTWIDNMNHVGYDLRYMSIRHLPDPL